jgi:CRISPR-associated endonuclease/helicase Cas3
MTTPSYDEMFRTALGLQEPVGPFDYQRRLATGDNLPQLLDIPTGLGKTLAIVLAWIWRRCFAGEAVRKGTPRRLVYCLPMRVLVEQTYGVIIRCLEQLGLLAGEARWLKVDEEHGEPGTRRIAVHLLMGGEEATDWAPWPEREAILIGTQDMLLSRALNRGYAARRARWPVEFGLLQNDCLWVFDEVQLMGSGLATTAQLDAFARKLWKPAKSTRFLWMSATMGDSFLQTRDRRDWNLTDATRLSLSQEDLDNRAVKERLEAPKTLHVIKAPPKAAKILEAHPRGRISLLILNTVPVAKSVYEDIKQEIAKAVGKNRPKGPQPEICLLHSRFRPMDREQQMKRLLEFIGNSDKSGAVPDSEGLIIVSTQVVEAGFDLSAARLWSEIAPWPSVIQRLGRLNREGAQPEASASFWMPKSDDSNKGDASPNAKRVGPYEKTALNAGKKLLEAVIDKQAGGLAYRDALDAVLATQESQETMQNEPEVVIRPDDFFELFSTEPDLAGGFTNVSQFVRDQDRNVDVHVFWRDFDPAKVKQPNESAPVREELCSVPFFDLRQFVRKARAAWEWNFETGKWESRRAGDIQPGMTLLLPKSAGGYRADVGWTGDPKDDKFDVLLGSSEDDSLDADFLSGSQEWVSLSAHLTQAEAEMQGILQALGLQATPFGKALLTAAHWHDCGKSVGEWQDAVRKYVANACDKLDEVAKAAGIARFDEVVAEWRDRLRPKNGINEPWGKFPDVRAASLDSRLNLSDPERAELSRKLKVPFRPALRHEAASALAAWQLWTAETNAITALAVYLIACHHGKVRTILRSTRGSEDVFGLTDDTTLQAVGDVFPNQRQLNTGAKYIGACGEWDEANKSFTMTMPSWLQMVAELLGPKHEAEPATSEVIPESEPRALGPLALAYLESLLRAADVRASRQLQKGGIS